MSRWHGRKWAQACTLFWVSYVKDKCHFVVHLGKQDTDQLLKHRHLCNNVPTLLEPWPKGFWKWRLMWLHNFKPKLWYLGRGGVLWHNFSAEALEHGWICIPAWTMSLCPYCLFKVGFQQPSNLHKKKKKKRKKRGSVCTSPIHACLPCSNVVPFILNEIVEIMS